MEKVLNVLLSHQPASDVEQLVEYWNSLLDPNNLLIAYGGPRDSLDHINFQDRIFIDDPTLRTSDHQREGQGYTAVFREVARWLNFSSSHFEYIALFEFDHLPLVRDLNTRQTALLQKEQADVLAFHLQRIDHTSHPHYLHYGVTPEFSDFFRKVSVRQDSSVVLSMFGTGSFWKRNAFDAVAKFSEPVPIYFEIYLPTLAHHLGFRLRDYGEQKRFVHNLGDRLGQVESARREGAWTLHPVKTLPSVLSSISAA